MQVYKITLTYAVFLHTIHTRDSFIQLSRMITVSAFLFQMRISLVQLRLPILI